MRAPFLNRRNFLRGALGVSVGLPFLESVRRASAQDADAVKRFVCFFNCNGVQMDRFFPTSDGPLSAATLSGTALEPLTPFASRMLVPRGTFMVPRGWGRDGGPGDDHAKGMGHKLTADFLEDTEDQYARSISVDQEIARALHAGDRPALTLSVGRRSQGVHGNISYLGGGRPAIPENNPWLAYRDFMGLGSTTEERLTGPAALRRQSVLDLIGDEFDELKSAELSSSDKRKLEMHFDSIRDTETALSDTPFVACNLDATTQEALMGIQPGSVEADEQYRALGPLQMDVLSLALACGYTQSATLQWGSGAGGPVFKWDGMTHDYNHHKLSHGTTADDGGEEVDGYEDMLFDIDRWHMERLAYLLTRLDSYEEADGKTLLDNCVTVYANELSDGKLHHYEDLPWLVLGGAGYFKLGEQITLGNAGNSVTPHNKLLTMFMNAVGIPTLRFGGELGLNGEFDALKA